MSQIKSASFERTIVETTKMSYRSVTDDVSVYTVWKTTEVVGSGDHGTPAIAHQGLVDTAAIDKMQRGDFDVQDFEPIKSGKGRRFHPVIINAEGREYIRRNGNPMSYVKVWEHLERGKLFLFPKGDTPWVDVIDETKVDELYFMSSQDHSIVDIAGRLLPTARTFEFTNGSYDLEKASKLLADNPEVEIVPDRNGKLIRDIPSYNASEGRNREMHVKWMPSATSWEKTLKGMADMRDANGLQVLRASDYELLVKFDVLGLTAAGCRVISDDENELS